MNRSNPPRPRCPVCRAPKLPTMLLCDGCSAAFKRIQAAPGEGHPAYTYRLADWAIRRAVRLERAQATATAANVARGDEVRAKVARHALAEALLKIEATTVEEYRDRAHALVMNWKGEV